LANKLIPTTPLGTSVALGGLALSQLPVEAAVTVMLRGLALVFVTLTVPLAVLLTPAFRGTGFWEAVRTLLPPPPEPVPVKVTVIGTAAMVWSDGVRVTVAVCEPPLKKEVLAVNLRLAGVLVPPVTVSQAGSPAV
jgi:hypothetical protein